MTHDPVGDFLTDHSRREQAVEAARTGHTNAHWRYTNAYERLERLRRTLDENGLGDRYEQIAAEDLVELKRLESDEAIAWRAYERARARLEEANTADRVRRNPFW